MTAYYRPRCRKCGGPTKDVSWMAFEADALMCALCGDYQEFPFEAVKKKPGTRPDAAGSHREFIAPLSEARRKPGPSRLAQDTCTIEGCTGKYWAARTKTTMCRKCSAKLYSWQTKGSGQSPPPFVGMAGIWQINPERIEWESQKHAGGFKRVSK